MRHTSRHYLRSNRQLDDPGASTYKLDLTVRTDGATSSSVRAFGAGEKPGTNPMYRARPGSKHHILVDANGMPVSVILTGVSRNDVTQLLPLVDATPPIRGTRGRPLRKPKVIYADRGYDSNLARERSLDRRIKPVIAKRRTGHGSGLDKFRSAVERIQSWPHNFRRIRIRFDRRSDTHEAFLNSPAPSFAGTATNGLSRFRTDFLDAGCGSSPGHTPTSSKRRVKSRVNTSLPFRKSTRNFPNHRYNR
jgi:transposase